MLITVVELEVFRRSAKNLLSSADVEALVTLLALHPKTGDLVKGTGGCRKVRWALSGKGKSGGARVIYFYYNHGMPLFLIYAYGKSQRANISAAQAHELHALVDILVKEYGG